ncbi:hypothetical protein [uncultured Microscilla sp.]|uniref:hypothetical protein n=1 Tax=uncultured Microscilla sp. TaxID=432653 RepID=UPI00260EFA07|nr:hypothetical protein [uncultured Microscilla sp.]
MKRSLKNFGNIQDQLSNYNLRDIKGGFNPKKNPFGPGSFGPMFMLGFPPKDDDDTGRADVDDEINTAF